MTLISCGGRKKKRREDEDDWKEEEEVVERRKRRRRRESMNSGKGDVSFPCFFQYFTISFTLKETL